MRKLVIGVLLFAAPLAAFGDFTGGAFRFYDGANYITLNAVAQTRLTQIAGAGSGGAFLVDAQNGSLPYWGTGDDLFTTYCVENGITFNTGLWYWTSVDIPAYTGHEGLTGDPVSDVTEWIYDQWLAGNPNGWSQGDISAAIWYAEEESGGSANAVYTAALSALSYSTGTDPGDFAAARHTRAMNLWSDFVQDPVEGYWYALDRQSHLIHVPLPAAAFLGLVGLGIAGWVKRRSL
ncbi:MAG: hypothetical protein IT450_18770 [Phycisphaerales bacterium]|nr:hypothetical protein [Phycisphaerales bacterium]